ncbi:hypothetical protein [Myxococcus xanthus]|uniref:hypothetical protein n=1 Tax=Myxococcus xanthus TaxID=34 RepID=UPI00116476D4|nr:hypothetical protein [Myxococcus xanthus]QDE83115.1 hypothetical protein BHS07_16955 [Myxococcus xanthus]
MCTRSTGSRPNPGRPGDALGKTFELVATTGPAPKDVDALFASLDAESPGALDGVRDMANMPLEGEPKQVLDGLNALRTLH